MRMKKFLSVLTVAGAMMSSAAPCGAAQVLTSSGALAAKFAVIADPHFYDQSLGTTGAAFEAYLASDRKMLRESEAILASAVASIKAKKPDFVVVVGDLTKDGEEQNHQKFASYMAQLEAAGIKVYVCPGNHDINNPHAYAYSGATKTSVPNVSPGEFAAVYNDFGFGEALDRDSASLSYLAEPVPGLWLLSLDVCKYEDNAANGSSETSGAFRPETMAWVLQKLADAREQGKTVMAIMHHGITEHYTGQSTAFPEYVVDEYEKVSAKLANAGLRLVFTGHYHANDITETSFDNGRPNLFDVETGSLVTYPSPFRLVTLQDDKAAVHTEYVAKINYSTGGVAFPTYAKNYLYQGLLGLASYSLIYQYGLSSDVAAVYAPYIADAFMAHYAGDETPTAQVQGLISYLIGSGDATMMYLGQMLSGLWTDLPPADTYGLLDFSRPITLSMAGSYSTGVFDNGASEIVAYDPASKRLFVVNGDSKAVDVLNAADPENPTFLFNIPVAPYGGGVNSVAVKDGVVAAAVEAAVKQDPGKVVFFDANGTYINQVTVGALPDMVAFTPDGKKVLTANEGEPNDAYTNDPEGSVSIVDISGGVAAATVATVGFESFNDQADVLRAAGVRIFGLNATVARDMEPEYIAVSSDSATAWVACQENNAIAVVDLLSNVVTDIQPLGYKDHGLSSNGLDASDKDGAINIATYTNLFGMHQPDGISTFEAAGGAYLLTANEGDSRDYDGFSEEKRVSKLKLDATAFPDASTLKGDAYLGRLTATTTLGDTDGDGDYDELYAFGSRSFSIWKPTDSGMELVFDSQDEIEQITAAMFPEYFNSDNTDNDSFDSRSDNKGPEPEGAAVGVIAGRTYAFVGLEGIGGIMVYEITDPSAPKFIQYINHRDFSVDAEAGVADNAAGDLGPEGLEFIPASESPNGENMLVTANEVSGTTTLYNICADGASVVGDLDGDGDVDSNDIAIITFHRNQPAGVYPAADLDGDGAITALDIRKGALRCTRSGCAAN
ncbi:MAG: choice-of-anchor I family protein [Syntrophobacteraceae bacterium]